MPAAAFENPSFGEFFVAVVIAAATSMWVYWHATRRGSAHATAWGVATFLCVGLVLPLYLIHSFASRRRG